VRKTSTPARSTKIRLIGWAKNVPTRLKLQAGSACSSATAFWANLYDPRKILVYSFFFSANSLVSRSTISTNWILSASGSGGRTPLRFTNSPIFAMMVMPSSPRKKSMNALPAFGCGAFAAGGESMPVPLDFSGPAITRRPAFLTENEGVLRVGDGDGRFAGGDALGGRQQRFDQDRLLRREVADIFVGLLLPAEHLVQARDPLSRRRVLRRVGHDDLAAVLRLNQVFERLRRVGRFDRSFIVDDADNDIAVARAEIRIDRVFRERLGGRRIVLREETLLLHDLQRVVVRRDAVEQRLAGAVFRLRAVHDLGRRRAPVIDLDAGFFRERFRDRLHRIRFERPVDDGLALFLRRGRRLRRRRTVGENRRE